MQRIERSFEVDVPVHAAYEQWKQLEPALEMDCEPQDGAALSRDVDAALHDFRQGIGPRGTGLAGRQAAGNPAGHGVAPGGAGGAYPGSTGGTPGAGGGKPGTTPGGAPGAG